MKQTIWKYIKADALFRDYLPHVKSYKYKIRGKNSRGNPIYFSAQEKLEIEQAIHQVSKDIFDKKKCKK